MPEKKNENFFFCLITIRINSFVFGYVGMYRLDSKRLTMCDQDLPSRHSEFTPR